MRDRSPYAYRPAAVGRLRRRSTAARGGRGWSADACRATLMTGDQFFRAIDEPLVGSGPARGGHGPARHRPPGAVAAADHVRLLGGGQGRAGVRAHAERVHRVGGRGGPRAFRGHGDGAAAGRRARDRRGPARARASRPAGGRDRHATPAATSTIPSCSRSSRRARASGSRCSCTPRTRSSGRNGSRGTTSRSSSAIRWRRALADLEADLRRRAGAAAPCASASPTAAARFRSRSGASNHGWHVRPGRAGRRSRGSRASTRAASGSTRSATARPTSGSWSSTFGADRVVIGSDYPFDMGFDDPVAARGRRGSARGCAGAHRRRQRDRVPRWLSPPVGRPADAAARGRAADHRPRPLRRRPEGARRGAPRRSCAARTRTPAWSRRASMPRAAGSGRRRRRHRRRVPAASVHPGQPHLPRHDRPDRAVAGRPSAPRPGHAVVAVVAESVCGRRRRGGADRCWRGSHCPAWRRQGRRWRAARRRSIRRGARQPRAGACGGARRRWSAFAGAAQAVKVSVRAGAPGRRADRAARRAGDLGRDDRRADDVDVHAGAVSHPRRGGSRMLGLDEGRVRVIAPDVGGGFGVKGGPYREEILVAWLARRLRASGEVDLDPPGGSADDAARARRPRGRRRSASTLTVGFVAYCADRALGRSGSIVLGTRP